MNIGLIGYVQEFYPYILPLFYVLSVGDCAHYMGYLLLEDLITAIFNSNQYTSAYCWDLKNLNCYYGIFGFLAMLLCCITVEVIHRCCYSTVVKYSQVWEYCCTCLRCWYLTLKLKLVISQNLKGQCATGVVVGFDNKGNFHFQDLDSGYIKLLSVDKMANVLVYCDKFDSFTELMDSLKIPESLKRTKSILMVCSDNESDNETKNFAKISVKFPVYKGLIVHKLLDIEMYVLIESNICLIYCEEADFRHYLITELRYSMRNAFKTFGNNVLIFVFLVFLMIFKASARQLNHYKSSLLTFDSKGHFLSNSHYASLRQLVYSEVQNTILGEVLMPIVGLSNVSLKEAFDSGFISLQTSLLELILFLDLRDMYRTPPPPTNSPPVPSISFSKNVGLLAWAFQDYLNEIRKQQGRLLELPEYLVSSSLLYLIVFGLIFLLLQYFDVPFKFFGTVQRLILCVFMYS
ncbi:hypothetical protein WICPIJ_006951 [Wickerhamomyces pijperi]|uniref:Uncharacterized protein n=1 Tax=Wickerhamomyces pijperi TaxID=599730 RepID=A0A9P8Q0S7_WICPI|nr:hypothetical protein WICPIJ_006951 [Wickerhamomyces pijperi]